MFAEMVSSKAWSDCRQIQQISRHKPSGISTECRFFRNVRVLKFEFSPDSADALNVRMSRRVLENKHSQVYGTFTINVDAVPQYYSTTIFLTSSIPPRLHAFLQEYFEVPCVKVRVVGVKLGTNSWWGSYKCKALVSLHCCDKRLSSTRERIFRCYLALHSFISESSLDSLSEALAT